MIFLTQCFKIYFSYFYYKTHTGENHVACKICERKFARKKDLVKQQATHNDNRHFKCSICPEGRYFKRKDCLRQHVVFHYELVWIFLCLL